MFVQTGRPHCVCSIALVVAALPVSTLAQAPSVCITVQDGCHVPGAIVTATVDMGVTDSAIISGRLSIQYDPVTLELLDVLPGNACDPASPFVILASQSFDKVEGQATVGVDVDLGAPGTRGPATMACLRFVVVSNTTSGVCLFDGPTGLALIDEAGQTVSVDNSTACPSQASPPIWACDDVVGDSTCDCVTGPPDCSFWDDACHVGVCNATTARCESAIANEGFGCDDGNACTTVDRCNAGECIGIGCTDPSLCVVTEPVCRAVGETVVRVELGKGESVITGGQFSLRYDPSAVEFLSISPGHACDPASPFELEIYEYVDAVQGEIFYATAIQPFGFTAEGLAGTDQASSPGPVTMACVRFGLREPSLSATCLFNGANHTILVDDFGQGVVPYNGADCPVDAGAEALSCGDMLVTEECRCEPGMGDCSGLDSECRTGVCDESSNQCITVPIREGEVCDDGDRCTESSTCVAGECVGTSEGLPSLCVQTEGLVFDGGFGVDVSIQLGETTTEILGGQFSMRFDATALDFVSATPGRYCDAESPFSTMLFLNAENAPFGEIFFAVGEDVGGVGSYGPATLACLRFRVKDFPREGICILEGINPFRTVLVSSTGQAVCVENSVDCPSNLPPPVLSCDDVSLIIPALNLWGLVILTLLLLIGAKIRLSKCIPRTLHLR